MAADRVRPLSVVLGENSIGLTKGYEFVNSGQLKVVKLGKRTMVRDTDWNEFLASLPGGTLPAPKCGRYLNRAVRTTPDAA